MSQRPVQLLIGLALSSAALCAQAPTVQAPLPQQYAELLVATMEEKADARDVDRLLSLYSADVVYEHPRVGAKIQGKEEIRTGMLRWLGETRNPKLRITRKIEGRSVFVLEFELTAEAKSEGAWKPLARTQVVVLETDASNISRVIDHW